MVFLPKTSQDCSPMTTFYKARHFVPYSWYLATYMIKIICRYETAEYVG